MSIKPGPKRTNEDGTPDKRQRVTPEKQKDHPDLKPHKHKKGSKKKAALGLLFLGLCANPPDRLADQSDRVVSLPLGLMDSEATSGSVIPSVRTTRLISQSVELILADSPKL
ncbi:hypothetical protein GLGCALEP_00014 [Pseudomonas sp. MM221]|nr:hypothetical protein GLGCALEP_00014 [Pseudomonas sp. MM221]